eukprot:2056902-Prymnesium_polylepis.1
MHRRGHEVPSPPRPPRAAGAAFNRQLHIERSSGGLTHESEGEAGELSRYRPCGGGPRRTRPRGLRRAPAA